MASLYDKGKENQGNYQGGKEYDLLCQNDRKKREVNSNVQLYGGYLIPTRFII